MYLYNVYAICTIYAISANFAIYAIHSIYAIWGKVLVLVKFGIDIWILMLTLVMATLGWCLSWKLKCLDFSQNISTAICLRLSFYFVHTY